MYPDERYPPYVLGSFYTIPSSLIECLVEQMEQSTFISVEDVFITGVLRERCHADLHHVSHR